MNAESNILIAEFLGFKIDEETGNYFIPMDFIVSSDFKEWADTKHINDIGYYLLSENQLYFAFDWNWLMEVVEKIENTSCYVNIKGCAVNMSTIVETSAPTKIQAVYNACIEFIKWYNSVQKEN